MPEPFTHELEIWKPIARTGGAYEVSDMGRVRSLDRIRTFPATKKTARHTRKIAGRILKPSIIGDGYHGVTLGALGRRYVHHLVLEAFVGPRPRGMECRHGNDVKSDNRLSNLSWGSKSQNYADAIRNGGRLKADGAFVNAKLTVDQALEVKALAHLRPVEISEITGIDQFNCAAIKSGRNWAWLNNGADNAK